MWVASVVTAPVPESIEIPTELAVIVKWCAPVPPSDVNVDDVAGWPYVVINVVEPPPMLMDELTVIVTVDLAVAPTVSVAVTVSIYVPAPRFAFTVIAPEAGSIEM